MVLTVTPMRFTNGRSFVINICVADAKNTPNRRPISKGSATLAFKEAVFIRRSKGLL